MQPVSGAGVGIGTVATPSAAAPLMQSASAQPTALQLANASLQAQPQALAATGTLGTLLNAWA